MSTSVTQTHANMSAITLMEVLLANVTHAIQNLAANVS